MATRLSGGESLSDYIKRRVDDLLKNSYPMYKEEAGLSSEVEQFSIISVPDDCPTILQATEEHINKKGIGNLVSVKNRNSAYWGIRFSYPDMKKAPTNPWARPCQGGTYNYRYFAQGEEKDKKIFPLEVWDNGTFTCFKFPIGGDLPVIFKKLPDGKEGLVNSHIENDYIVIHEINDEYRVRLGDLVVGVKTDKLKARQTINGTTNGKTREVIDE